MNQTENKSVIATIFIYIYIYIKSIFKTKNEKVIPVSGQSADRKRDRKRKSPNFQN